MTVTSNEHYAYLLQEYRKYRCTKSLTYRKNFMNRFPFASTLWETNVINEFEGKAYI